MFVIIKNNLVKNFSESSVRIVRTSINTNSGINVLTSRKNHLFETDSSFIFLSLEFVECFSSDVFGNKRFGSSWPHWWSSNLFWFHQMRSTLNWCATSSSSWGSWSSTKSLLSSDHSFD